MKRNLLFLVVFFISLSTFAQQFEADLQIRPRFEYRNGFKTLISENEEAVSLISQRSRLKMDFRKEKLKMRFSLQDVRIWGDVPTLAQVENNTISVFEAFAEYAASENLHLRIGRQDLAYDNQRIFGQVDWAQQGQSHDAFLLSWALQEKQRLDLGLASSAEGEVLVETPYLVNNYKNMQFAWYHLETGSSGWSFLLANTAYEWQQSTGVWQTQYQQTFGSFLDFTTKAWSGDAALYGQTGKRNGQTLKAFYAGANLNRQITPLWRVGVGGEILSGTDANADGDVNKSFTPLFGTNHAFNGFMDYFYVGNHQNSVGLIDIYTKATYSSAKTSISLIPHLFWAAAQTPELSNESQKRYLGTEIDLVGGYQVSEDINLSLGYSQMFASESLESLKGGSKDELQNWAWLSVSFNPTLFSFRGQPDNWKK